VEVDFDTCFVCGDADNNYMTKLEEIVQLPGGVGSPPETVFPVQCADLYTDGLTGAIPTNSCALITQLSIIPCGCMPPDFTCSVCGFGGYTVQAPEAQLTIPGVAELDMTAAGIDVADGSSESSGDGTTYNCGDLELQGSTGQLTPEECVAAADAIILSDNACGCALNPELAIEFPTCNICDGLGLGLGVDDEGGIGNNGNETNYVEQVPSTPDVLLLLSDSDANATCGELYEVGVQNGLGTARCRAAQIQAVDNCNCAPGPAPVVPALPALPALPVPAPAPAPAPGTTMAPIANSTAITFDPVSEEEEVPTATLVDPTTSGSGTAISLEGPTESAASLSFTISRSSVVVLFVVVGMLVIVL